MPCNLHFMTSSSEINLFSPISSWSLSVVYEVACVRACPWLSCVCGYMKHKHNDTDCTQKATEGQYALPSSS
jgi:hypothetical protein